MLAFVVFTLADSDLDLLVEGNSQPGANSATVD